MDKFKCKKGMLVKLKSGGPVMTVQGIKGMGPHIVCIWFDVNHVYHKREFYAECLMEANHILSLNGGTNGGVDDSGGGI